MQILLPDTVSVRTALSSHLHQGMGVTCLFCSSIRTLRSLQGCQQIRESCCIHSVVSGTVMSCSKSLSLTSFSAKSQKRRLQPLTLLARHHQSLWDRVEPALRVFRCDLHLGSRSYLTDRDQQRPAKTITAEPCPAWPGRGLVLQRPWVAGPCRPQLSLYSRSLPREPNSCRGCCHPGPASDYFVLGKTLSVPRQNSLQTARIGA